MKARDLGLALIAGVATLCAGTSAAEAATCNGTLTGDIAGDVVVQKDASCTLSQVNVSGSVLVATGAGLTVDGRQYPSVIRGDIEAQHCAFALLKGAVTISGAFHVQHCARDSGFIGPGVTIGGDFHCHDNAGACFANFGDVNGDVHVHNNNSSTAANISQLAIAGNLDCYKNSPAPTHIYGPDRVAGTASGQCVTFTPPSTVPNCTALATDSAYGLAGNPLVTAMTATLVVATPAN